MSLTAPLGNSYMLMREQPKVIVPLIIFLVAIVVGAAFAAGAFASIMNSTSGSGMPAVSSLVAAIWPVALIVVIIVFIFGAILEGMYISVAQQGRKGKVVLKRAWDVAISRLGQLLALDIILGIIYTLVVVALALLTGVPAAIGKVISLIVSGVTTGTGAYISVFISLFSFFGLLAIVALILGIFFYLAPIIVVLEGKNAADAINRSVSLGKKYFFTILLFLILVAVVNAVLGFALGLLSLIPILGAVIRIVGDMLLSVWAAMLPTMFYFEYVKTPNEPVSRRSKK